MIMRQFVKSISVFKEWREDDEKSLKRGFLIDMSFSKLLKFIRDSEVYSQVTDVLYKYLPQLKDIFTYIIGTSSYPSVSWLDFTDLCTKWNIIGKLF